MRGGRTSFVAAKQRILIAEGPAYHVRSATSRGRFLFHTQGERTKFDSRDS